MNPDLSPDLEKHLRLNQFVDSPQTYPFFSFAFPKIENVFPSNKFGPHARLGENDCNQGLLLSVLGIFLGILACLFFEMDLGMRGLLYGFAIFQNVQYVPFFGVVLNINITWRLQIFKYLDTIDGIHG